MKQTTKCPSCHSSSLVITDSTVAAKVVHPEDLEVGDYVSYESSRYQCPSFLWNCTDPTLLPPERIVEMKLLPSDDNYPMKVESICLPFVLCKKHDKQPELVDVRRADLFRLSKKFSKSAKELLKPDKEKSETKAKKKKKAKKGRKKKKN